MTQSIDIATEETHKSNLLLQAALLRDQGDLDQASSVFAAAAEIEERLAQAADARNDHAHALRAWYSAASAWAHAGDFHHALILLRMLEFTTRHICLLLRREQNVSRGVILR